jgi:hypothetical protein
MSPDYVHDALRSTREDFVARHPFPFLVGVVSFGAPPVRSIDTLEGGGFEAGTTMAADEVTSIARPAPPPPGSPRPTVLAVRKVHETFPSMITVGRTRNNDIVLPDLEVSKFHAFFREVEGGSFELVDAGSANGTRVGDTVLKPKGPAHPVRFGDRVGFAYIELVFLDATSCWAELQGLKLTPH